MFKGVDRILVVRTDKIGDVVLTTPAIAALRKQFPESKITGMVSEIAADVYLSNPHLNAVIVLKPEEYLGIGGFFRLVKRIRSEKFQIVVVFQARLRVALAIWFSGIPYRIGPLSKWWSWLIYNLGRRQIRSAVEMHEADYNIQLLREFGISVMHTREKTHLTVDDEAKAYAEESFRKLGIQRRFRTVAIHPGMAGSALNWSEGHYVALGRRLLHRYNVLVTGGPGEQALVDRVVQGIARNQGFAPEKPVFASYVGQEGLKKFIAVLGQSDGLVAPSTGPLHLAVALGKKVVTVYPPIKVQSAVRWGPYGTGFGTNLGVSSQDQASVLVPDVNCAEDFKCALQACIYYPCMPRVSVADVEAQMVALLEGGSLSMIKNEMLGDYDIDEPYEDLEP